MKRGLSRNVVQYWFDTCGDGVEIAEEVLCRKSVVRTADKVSARTL